MGRFKKGLRVNCFSHIGKFILNLFLSNQLFLNPSLNKAVSSLRGHPALVICHHQWRAGLP